MVYTITVMARNPMIKNEPRTVRERLRFLRGLAFLNGYTSLTELCHDLGVSYNHLWKVLRAERIPSRRLMRGIVERLGPEALRAFPETVRHRAFEPDTQRKAGNG